MNENQHYWYATITYLDGRAVLDPDEAKQVARLLNTDGDEDWAIDENQGHGDFLITVPARIADALEEGDDFEIVGGWFVVGMTGCQ